MRPLNQALINSYHNRLDWKYFYVTLAKQSVFSSLDIFLTQKTSLSIQIDLEAGQRTSIDKILASFPSHHRELAFNESALAARAAAASI